MTSLMEGESEWKIKLIPDSDAGTLTVSDNGIGIPEGFDPSSVNSMGLKLINALIHQIDGSFEIIKENGTRCLVNFPIK